MADSGKVASRGLGPIGALGVLFVGLKLGGVITWSWWWVTLPFWWWAPVAGAIFVCAGLVGLFSWDGGK